MTAQRALRIVAVALLALALALVAIAATLPGAMLAFLVWPSVVVGGLVAVIGLAGPARIIAKAAMVPSEIRRLVLVQAVTMPVAGLALVAGGLAGGSAQSLSYAAAALMSAASALWGFLPLSRAFPRGFSLGEMLKIVESAGLLGPVRESPADREFRRWTGGEREGVAVGAEAPSGVVFSLDGEERLLGDVLREAGDAFVVLNFVSYSCPHYRSRIAELEELHQRWCKRGVTLLNVYIAEAHPEDGWKLPGQYEGDAEFTNTRDFSFHYAKSLEERLAMARRLVDAKGVRWPTFVGALDDALLRAYNAWPIRLYVIQNSRVLYAGAQGPFGYEPAAIDRVLTAAAP